MTIPDGFAAHPEGGSYVETWRSARAVAGRDAVTAIAFHLEPGETSSWHRLHGGAELWVWNGGGRLRLELGGNGPTPTLAGEVVLGPGGQHLVAADEWQTASPVDAAVRCACIVSPGFEFADLEIWRDGQSAPTPRILLVCEGNLCRSPTAELLLRYELALRGAAARFEVSSAGLRTEPGLPMERHASAALNHIRTTNTTGFRTSKLDDATADLILTATTAQRDAVVAMTPEMRERVFAWRELVALAATAPLAAAPLEDVVRELRSRRGSIVPPSADAYDVPDPIGRSARTFRRTAESIAASMAQLAELLATTTKRIDRRGCGDSL